MARINSYPTVIPTAGDLVLITDTSETNNPTKTATAGSLATLTQAVNLGYVSYHALLTQAGVTAPVATVLQNSITGTMTWSRQAVGQYVITNDGTPFTAGKVLVFVNNGSHGDDKLVGWLPVNTSNVSLTTGNLAGANADAVLTNASIEIRVYA